MDSIKLTKIASEALLAIDAKTRSQILSKIEQLKEAPLLLGKPLLGPLKEFRSLRAAGQRDRIIFKVIESQIIVLVVAVGIRKAGDKKDIYELMKKYVRVGILGKDDEPSRQDRKRIDEYEKSVDKPVYLSAEEILKD